MYIYALIIVIPKLLSFSKEALSRRKPKSKKIEYVKKPLPKDEAESLGYCSLLIFSKFFDKIASNTKVLQV